MLDWTERWQNRQLAQAHCSFRCLKLKDVSLSGFHQTLIESSPTFICAFLPGGVYIRGWLRDYWSLGKKNDLWSLRKKHKCFINVGALLGNRFSQPSPAFSYKSGISRLVSQRRTLAFVNCLPVAPVPRRWRWTWLSTFCSFRNRSFCLCWCAGRLTTQNSRRSDVCLHIPAKNVDTLPGQARKCPINVLLTVYAQTVSWPLRLSFCRL